MLESLPSMYAKFCGVILLNNNTINGNNDFLSGHKRLNNSSIFQQHLNKSYYQNYLSNIAPEENTSRTGHYTLQDFFLDKPRTIRINLEGDQATEFTIPYFDIFIFPEGVGIFAFKVQPVEGQATYESVSLLLNKLRNPDTVIQTEGREVTVREFIKINLQSGLTLAENWDQYIPQLKAYTIIDDPSATSFTEELDRKLFELAHALPIGASLKTEFAPAPQYYQSVMQNSISVYNNWKAIALFDTFTRISCSYPDTYNTWENEYFLIYIHSLYTKFMLYRFNSQLKDVYTVSKHTKTIRNRFIEFVNDYHLAYISYKFLPNLLYEKINQSLEIQKELDRMETKIERIHESNQEKKSQQMNTLLLLISLLSILSVITDLSQWLTEMGLPEQIVYSPVVPFFLIGIVVLIGFWLFRKT